MNKSELRKARKEARLEGKPLGGELKLVNIKDSKPPERVRKFKVKMDWNEWYAKHY